MPFASPCACHAFPSPADFVFGGTPREGAKWEERKRKSCWLAVPNVVSFLHHLERWCQRPWDKRGGGAFHQKRKETPSPLHGAEENGERGAPKRREKRKGEEKGKEKKELGFQMKGELMGHLGEEGFIR
eukprot:TRINITY_DN320_c0_g1_i1.p1 TRINITY_DN320_c0_g1~~TRINITY_DN320_c0_g1_i1.p1  ORF type:complete len:129 (-),score=23.10 TRINITY_DN320_c0_g1_i1:1095-1481(-)